MIGAKELFRFRSDHCGYSARNFGHLLLSSRTGRHAIHPFLYSSTSSPALITDRSSQDKNTRQTARSPGLAFLTLSDEYLVGYGSTVFLHFTQEVHVIEERGPLLHLNTARCYHDGHGSVDHSYFI